jgi:prepilin-type N-terminal cleavage/methylation domain-containing protein
MKLNKSRQSGFTLVEIAIVLVIIGLLLGGVLKGQDMIENARIKGLVSNVNGVSAAYNSYVDRYQEIPGDEALLTAGNRGWAGIVGAGGNANGALNIQPPQTFTNAGEQALMWNSLRASGFFKGSLTSPANATGLPTSATGGLMGVSVSPYGLVGVAVCISNLTTKQAAGMDTIFDGQAPGNVGNNVGNFVGATGAVVPLVPTPAAPAGQPYSETTVVTPWTMCRTL